MSDRWPRLLQGRVVDENIEATRWSAACATRLRQNASVRRSPGMATALAPLRLDQGDHFLRVRLFGRQVVDGNVGPFASVRDGRGPADAAVAAGDKRLLAGQPAREPCSSSRHGRAAGSSSRRGRARAASRWDRGAPDRRRHPGGRGGGVAASACADARVLEASVTAAPAVNAAPARNCGGSYRSWGISPSSRAKPAANRDGSRSHLPHVETPLAPEPARDHRRLRRKLLKPATGALARGDTYGSGEAFR